MNTLLTSGEHSDYQIEKFLNVPSMEWLRERFAEYKSLKAAMDDWQDSKNGYYTLPPDFDKTTLHQFDWFSVVDSDYLNQYNKIIHDDFGSWLLRTYPNETSEPQDFCTFHLDWY